MGIEQIISYRPAGQAGFLEDPLFDEIKSRLRPLVKNMVEEIENGTASYLSLPFHSDDLKSVQAEADRIRRNSTDVVVLGVGGSSLGAQALCDLSHNDKSSSLGFPTLHFPENLNADSISILLDSLDFGTAHFVVISKSGNTTETITQMALSLAGAHKSLKESDVREHFSVIAGPGDNALRQMAEINNFTVFDHPDDLCGRFSVFSSVGLLPAAIAGIDVIAVRRGARDVLEALGREKDVIEAPAVMGAAIHEYLVNKCGIGITVLMPYDERLDSFSRWFQQLWSESLGKNGKGTTPLRALGPADQHSQLQLFLDGPPDKFVTVIIADTAGQGPMITDEISGIEGLDYLIGCTVGDVVAAEARATIDALVGQGRPVREIRIPDLSERTIGALMMSFMIETVLTAGLMGEDAFNQPAVEQIKKLTISNLEEKKLKG